MPLPNLYIQSQQYNPTRAHSATASILDSNSLEEVHEQCWQRLTQSGTVVYTKQETKSFLML